MENREAQVVFDRCASRLLRLYPFWGSLLLGLEVRASRTVSKMVTDGAILTYNPEYVVQQRETIVCTDQAHEAAHRMFMDHLRRGHRGPKIWNVATDYRINLYLRDSGLELGEDYLVDERFRGMDAEEIYDLLVNDPEDPANEQAEAKGGCGCGGLRDQQQSSGDPEGEQDEGGSSGSDDGGEEEGDEDGEQEGPGGEPTDGPDEGSGEESSSVMADFGGSEVLMALAQACAFAKAQGKLPSSIEEVVEETLNPKIRWEQIVQRFMEYCSQDDFSWQVPDRRFLYMDVYLPGIESEGVDEFVVAVDTSGSTIPYVGQFLSEVSAIAKALKFRKLHVLYCDAKVQHADEYDRADLPIRPARTYGGGGTDFRPVFAWLEERAVSPKGMVFLTDTHGPFPSAPAYPVLWAVPREERASVPFGEVVEIG